jgi:hypothetical protein
MRQSRNGIALPRGRNGIALMMVLVALIFLSLISFEFMYASRVDLKISSSARNRLQAWYLAQSASRIALLRLHLFQKAIDLKQGGTPLPIDENILDQIWSFPLPSFPFPGQVYGKDHRLPGEISSLVQSEGSLIPINLLDGNRHRKSSKKIAEQVLEELKQLFTSAMEHDEAFEKAYRGMRFEDLFMPLVDWIDKDGDRREGGGDETADYERLDPPYEPRNDRIPAISELHMVHNWNDDLVKRFGREFSVIKSEVSLNPNYISLTRLKSFHPDLSKEDLDAIEARRKEQPFKSLQELATFIQSSPDVRNGQGFSFPKDLKSSTTESIFKVEASGIVGQATRKIRLGVRLEELEDKKKQGEPDAAAQATKGNTPDSNPEDKNKPKIKYGPPEVVSVEVVL